MSTGVSFHSSRVPHRLHSLPFIPKQVSRLGEHKRCRIPYLHGNTTNCLPLQTREQRIGTSTQLGCLIRCHFMRYLAHSWVISAHKITGVGKRWLWSRAWVGLSMRRCIGVGIARRIFPLKRQSIQQTRSRGLSEGDGLVHGKLTSFPSFAGRPGTFV
jgi:hypothetical protein